MFGRVYAVVAAFLLLACSPATSSGQQAQQDYAAARASFQTHLLRHGHPDNYDYPKPSALAQEVTYPSGALTLRAWVGMPDNAAPGARLPVVIFLHGGFAFGAEDFDMAEPFRRAGYVIVTPLLRGEDGGEGEFSMFYSEVDDVLAALAFVKTQTYADPTHIYLAGHSVGGTEAMLSALTTDQFRAVASFSGSPDQVAFASGPPWNAIVPFDAADGREFAMRSPLRWPTSFKSPTRLFYGNQEAFFRGSTQTLAQRAHAAGLDVEAVEVVGDHFGAVPEEITRAITFFRQHA